MSYEKPRKPQCNIEDLKQDEQQYDILNAILMNFAVFINAENSEGVEKNLEMLEKGIDDGMIKVCLDDQEQLNNAVVGLGYWDEFENDYVSRLGIKLADIIEVEE